MNRFSLILVLICSMFLSACGGEGTETTSENETPSETVIKVEPQSFPVNDLSDSWFGKTITNETAEVSIAEENLTESQDSYPGWLDAIISRESIVAFASQVLAEMPDELEFVQSSQKHYVGPDNWKVFKVLFSTRPSNANIFVYGAYQSEEQSYWVSELSKEPVSMQMKAVAPGENGAVVQGTKGDIPFEIHMKKEEATRTSSGS